MSYFILRCHFDQALARGEISLFKYYSLYTSGFLDCARNDSKYPLEMTKEKSKPKYNSLAFILLLLTPQKIFGFKKILGKKEQSLCGRAVYLCKRLTCFAYCDAVAS